MSEVAVRQGSGPVHLAHPATEALLVAVCGARFRPGHVVPAKTWRRARRCAECDEATEHAPNRKMLWLIAGW